MEASMPFVEFQDIKEKFKFEDAVTLFGLNLKWNAERNCFRGACPKCEKDQHNKTGLVVTPSKGAYCFATRKGGDVIWLVSHILNVGMNQAAQEIERRTVQTNSTVRTAPQGESNGNAKATPTGTRTQQPPLSYLEAQHEAVQRLGVEPGTAQAFGAGFAPKGVLRGRIAIPLYDRQGEYVRNEAGHVQYVGLAADDQSPRLLFANGFNPLEHIFNAHRVSAGELYLVRDPVDVLLAHQNGIENVVCFLTTGISAQQVEMLASLMDAKGCDTLELY